MTKEEYLADLTSHLNEQIYSVSFNKFKDGYYADSVESACKKVNEYLKKLYKDKYETEKDGESLFCSCLSDKEDVNLFSLGDLKTQNGKNEQSGYMFLLKGMWQAMRNPKAHNNLHLSMDEAYDRLIFISMLMKRLEKAYNGCKR